MNLKKHPQLFDMESLIQRALDQRDQYLIQVNEHKYITIGGNPGAKNVTCSYCHQMVHMFNCCPFIDDRLRQLFKEEVMNIHQHVIPIIIITVPNASILGTLLKIQVQLVRFH